jgi:hypothetical protein
LKEFAKCDEIVGETRDRFEEKEAGLREAKTIYQQILYPENFESEDELVVAPEDAVDELKNLAEQYDDGSDGFIHDYLASVRNALNRINEGSDYGF